MNLFPKKTPSSFCPEYLWAFRASFGKILPLLEGLSFIVAAEIPLLGFGLFASGKDPASVHFAVTQQLCFCERVFWTDTVR